MVRETSKEVFRQIEAEGLLSKMRFKVFKAIYENAPCTSGEAFAKMITKDNQLTQSRARFTELRELGVIYEKGVRPCKITGRNVIEWDLTDRLPGKKSKEKTVKYISIVEAEAILNKNKKFHYIIRRVGTDNQLNMDV